MEKIKVNMSPNPLDVQTIHASQNDGEARQWGFELHNNGELIDTSDVKEQLFFKAYKGGTEQILPENTSTPTTSPFKGDIKYPQGLLTDQEFLYRQSPTEEDGNAKIKSIYGNTLVWNQLVQNGNFADTSIWSVTGAGSSFTVSNNIATVAASGAYDSIQQNVEFINGHKYLIKVDVKKTNANDDIRLYYGTHLGAGSYTFANTTEWQTRYIIRTASESTTSVYPNVEGTTSNLTWQQRNMMIFDLTQMGLDISNPSDFTSLFSLPYYDYNAGTLLSFNGNGLKTTRKNLFKLNPSATSSNIINVINEETGAVDVADTTTIRWSTPYIGYTDVVAGQTYTASLKGGVTLAYGRIGGSTTTGQPTSSNQPDTSIGGAITSLVTNLTPNRTFVANETQRIYWYYCTDSGNANHQEFTFYPQIELGSTATSHEPYTSSTLSLPISTYFPNGMKSAGTVYDELTPRKAITRIGSVDLGSLSWNYHSQSGNFYAEDAINNRKVPLGLNAKCSIYQQVNEDTIGGVSSLTLDKSFAFQTSVPKRIIVKNTSYTDATTFKSAMNGVMLYYELATPTETSFTTASLVTENAEIPLSNEDGVLIGKCTEQLSSESGFIDAKIKLADEDGECYSNKIQLHVERKPS